MEKQKRTLNNAKEAVQLMNEKAATLDEIKHLIYNAAETGQDFTLVFKVVPASVQADLMNLGFDIGIHKDPMGMKNVKISW